jgi:hypothetical protein
MKKSLLLGAVLLGASFSSAPVYAQSAIHLGATLTGANETGGGASDGSGTFSAEIDSDSGDLCFTLTADKIGTPTAAHIHTGAAGVDGDPIATLAVTGTDGEECVAVQHDVAKAIVANPAGYYVNVHTAEFPKGAIRGQLARKD